MTETKQNKNPRLTEPYILVAVTSSCLVLAARVARSETGSKWRQTERQTYGHQTLFRDPTPFWEHVPRLHVFYRYPNRLSSTLATYSEDET